MKFLKIIFVFVCVSASAQTKIGTIDIDFILSKMPELENVRKQVDDYGKELDGLLQKKYDTLNLELNRYKKDEVALTINQRKQRQDSLLAMEGNIQKFQENGSRLLALKREEFLQPLYQKIGVEIEKIAQAQGYTQIIQRNANLIYIDNTYDITLSVLKAMGIEIKEGE